MLLGLCKGSEITYAQLTKLQEICLVPLLLLLLLLKLLLLLLLLLLKLLLLLLKLLLLLLLLRCETLMESLVLLE